MKNILKKLGLAALVALSSGCRESREYAIEEPTIEQIGDKVEINGFCDRRPISLLLQSNKYSEYLFDTWRNYPSAGRTEPYVEVRENSFSGTNAILLKPFHSYNSGRTLN